MPTYPPGDDNQSQQTTHTAHLMMSGQLRQLSTGDLFVDDKLVSEDQNGVSDQNIDFLEDNPSEMTWGRRIALSLMERKWYNPRAGDTALDENGFDESFKDAQMDVPLDASDDPIDPVDNMFGRITTTSPNLKKAWAYFEHVTLTRFIVEKKKNNQKKNICRRIIRKFQKGDKKMERAEPGDNEVQTRLYSPVFTPHKQLGDFGLGIGLYFSTLRAIALITLVLGLVSSYNINYFASEAYMSDESRGVITNKFIQGSAVCTNTPWVPCPDCECISPNNTRRLEIDELLPNRCGDLIAIDTDGASNVTNLRVALKNDCDATVRQLGMVNYFTVILLLIATGCLGEYLRRQEVQFDEDEQTAQDYSIRIKNPPPDATDPEEWRQFFLENCDGAQATVCTVAVDNDILVRTLVQRREVLRTIQNTQEPGSTMTELKLAYMAARDERQRNWFGRLLAMVSPGIPELYARYVALSAKVQGLAQLDFPVTNVFMIFETEKDQRNVLRKLTVGSLKAYRNDHRALSDPKYLFRGKYVLAVEEPGEPSTIRWQDLNAGFIQKLKEQLLTAFATVCAIVAVGFIVFVASNASTVGAAFSIAAFNSIFPMFAKMLTGLEAHAAEGEKQSSLYLKIALFRWVNTAIVITIITPFTDTLAVDGGLIPQIYALFFAEILTVSITQLADPMGHINRHFFAPRAATQDAMNLKFVGAPWELAERYTDATKILFLCVWYCAIFPGSFFLCSFALFVKYFVDRFSLMRTWMRPPQLGTSVSKFSRRYFFSLAVVAMAIMSSFYWSGFPYDNLCEMEEPVDDAYLGSFQVVALDNGSSSRMHNTRVEFQQGERQYRVCSQNLMVRKSGRSFPFTPQRQTKGDEWMTPEQEEVTTIFGWTAVAITAIVIVKFVWGWVEMSQSLFRSTYSGVGDDQSTPFSQVASRSAYVPQVRSSLFPYPLIACDTDDVDEELYDWLDPERPYDLYDLTKDAMQLLAGIDVSAKVGFSKLKYWTPKME